MLHWIFPITDSFAFPGPSKVLTFFVWSSIPWNDRNVLSDMQVTSAPVSILNVTFFPQSFKSTVHGLLPTVCTAPRNISFVMPPSTVSPSTVSTDDFDRHHLAKCPMCPHLRHIASRAGHTCIACPCLFPQRLQATFVPDVPSLRQFATSFGFVTFCFGRYLVFTASMFSSSAFLPRTTLCCFFIDSFCLAMVMALSNVSSEFICIFSATFSSDTPTAIRSPPVRARGVKSRMCTSVSPAWS